MDYDAYVIAEVYDKARALLPATARLWQELLADYIDPGAAPLILDLGCGTGRFSELLAQRFGGHVIGIDPSERMVQQARRKPNPGNVSYWIASAEALPPSDDRADLVFMSMVYHHLGSPGAAARECHRVLRDGGYVCVRNGTRESDFPHRHFFALQPLIAPSFPPGPRSRPPSRAPGLPVSRIRWSGKRSLPTGPPLSRSPHCAATRFSRGYPITNFAPAWTRCRRMPTASTGPLPSAKRSTGSFSLGTGRGRSGGPTWTLIVIGCSIVWVCRRELHWRHPSTFLRLVSNMLGL